VSFVLDTCALSELTRPAPNPGGASWFGAQDPEALYLSVLIVGEIERAIAVLRHAATSLAAASSSARRIRVRYPPSVGCT